MKLKEYNPKNYPRNPISQSLRYLRRMTVLVLLASMVGTGMAASIIPPRASLEVKTQTAAPHTRSPDPLNDFHLIHGRLYGSRYLPVSRVETDLPLTYATEGFKIDLEWDGPDQNKLVATDRHGRYMGTRTVLLTPRADLDDDADVDEADFREFEANPFDIDLDGRIDASDHRQFKSWVGWRKPAKQR